MTRNTDQRTRGNWRLSAASRRDPWAAAGAVVLATQDREFVTQHEDLDFLGLSRSAAEHDQLEDVAQRQVRNDQTTGTQQRKARNDGAS